MVGKCRPPPQHTVTLRQHFRLRAVQCLKKTSRSRGRGSLSVATLDKFFHFIYLGFAADAFALPTRFCHIAHPLLSIKQSN